MPPKTRASKKKVPKEEDGEQAANEGADINLGLIEPTKAEEKDVIEVDLDNPS